MVLLADLSFNPEIEFLSVDHLDVLNLPPIPRYQLHKELQIPGSLRTSLVAMEDCGGGVHWKIKYFRTISLVSIC